MVLAVRSVGFRVGYLNEENKVLWVVRNIDLSVEEGSIHCIVGESGCGKTTLGLAITGILPPYAVTRGELYIFGKLVLKDDSWRYEGVRGRVTAYIPQNPGSSLNPFIKIWRQFWNVLKERGYNEVDAKNYAAEILKTVGLNPSVLDYYPNELSGGMQQRVAIGLSLATGAKLIVADEPTSNVDAHLKLHLMRVFKEIRDSYKTTIIIITHDILLAGKICDRISVMYAGEILEEGGALSILENPSHPYTRLLLNVVPVLGVKKPLRSIPGEPPSALYIEDARCSFYDRCPFRDSTCLIKPPIIEVDGKRVKCWKPLAKETA
ncbi:ABC transporter ATP-binding protein [Thermogladius sp. 4427co]|uniref:ABC transporter ATP-binding protein n=1 Tax=Thermogladius sp. 4427co TaxID=3450718 RepID=UPI003F7A00C8